MSKQILTKEQVLASIEVLQQLEEAEIFCDDRELGSLVETRRNLQDLLKYDCVWKEYQKYGRDWRSHQD